MSLVAVDVTVMRGMGVSLCAEELCCFNLLTDALVSALDAPVLLTSIYCLCLVLCVASRMRGSNPINMNPIRDQLLNPNHRLQPHYRPEE